jgi:hypothetical protein
MAAWRKAGFHIAGHIVFPKQYASSQRFMRYQHELGAIYSVARNRRPFVPHFATALHEQPMTAG